MLPGVLQLDRPACYGPSMVQTKTVAASQVTLVQLMEITDTNLGGIVHGGVIMKLVDTAAGLAAIKHAGGMCVTVSMDEMSFLAPAHIGDTITVLASVNDVGNTSLEVGVRVESEELRTGKRTHTSSAYLVFVALDDDGKPRAGAADRGRDGRRAAPPARGEDPARDAEGASRGDRAGAPARLRLGSRPSSGSMEG